MKELKYFTIGFLFASSLAIIMNLPESEVPGTTPDYGYNEPSYTPVRPFLIDLPWHPR